VSLSNNPARSLPLGLPRWVYVRFPRGSMLGEPGNKAKQAAVLRDALAALTTMQAPGSRLDLTYRWEGAPIQWRGKGLVEGSSS
jgi:hypothetical protein